MSLKNLFQILWKNESEAQLIIKIKDLELNLKEMNNKIVELQESTKSNHTEYVKEPPIIIEKINIEKIILDKYELNNNFGQLGIKELKGKLNIGATYGTDVSPFVSEMEDEEMEEMRAKEKKPQKGPKINIKTKKD